MSGFETTDDDEEPAREKAEKKVILYPASEARGPDVRHEGAEFSDQSFQRSLSAYLSGYSLDFCDHFIGRDIEEFLTAAN